MTAQPPQASDPDHPSHKRSFVSGKISAPLEKRLRLCASNYHVERSLHHPCRTLSKIPGDFTTSTEQATAGVLFLHARIFRLDSFYKRLVTSPARLHDGLVYVS